MRDVTASVEACGKQDHLGMSKVAPDVRRYETIIRRTRPTLIIETGTYQGQSAKWFTQFAPVVTIDIDPKRTMAARNLADVTAICGSSVDPNVLHTVYDLAKGHRVLVSLDSHHSPEHVLAEMNAYAPLVHPGGYMVVEDGIMRYWLHHPGPLDAIESWLKGRPDWAPDMELEDCEPITLFPSGWLVRLR